MILFAALLIALPWLLIQPGSRLRNLARRPPESREVGANVPVTVLLELLVAALQTGVSIPRSLKTVGTAVAGRDGPVLAKAGRQLELGVPWDQAWSDPHRELLPIVDALRHAWEAGASPTMSLRTAGELVRRQQLEASRLAAARLTVRLVLPLGLCLLPAFVLMGLVPVLLSLGSGLLG